MIATTISEHRIIENKDWASILFIFSLILIALAKNIFETRFNDFLRILVSDKYIRIYKESTHLLSGFTILLFIVQLISFTFLIQLILDYFNYVSKNDWVIFIRIFTFLSVFVLSKYLIEKIIATTFNIEEITEQHNLQKVSYRTFIGLILIPINIILYYNDNISKYLIFSLIIIILVLNLLTYLVSLRNYQNLIISKLFYFILYLCALEIAPYYFIYYLITKN
jgi:hypothetical protein